MNKTVFVLLFIMLIGNVAVLGETKKQDTTGKSDKPQVLWKWGTDLEPTDVNDIVASDSFFLTPSKSGALTCVDFQTGSIKWIYALPDEQLKKPAIENKNIILSGSKTIVCLNESGKEVWKKNFAYLERQFVTGNGLIVFTHRNLDQWHQQSHDLFLACLDTGSGKMLWEEITDPNQYDYGIVQLVDGLLYVVPSTYTPVIKCLDPATGKLF